MRSRRGKFKRTTPGEPSLSETAWPGCARGDRGQRSGAPRPAAPQSHVLFYLRVPFPSGICKIRGSPAGVGGGTKLHLLPSAGGSRWARPTRAPCGASTHLRSEVEEQGNAAHDLAQSQPQEGHERGPRGGGGRGGCGRRRGVQRALVRGARAAHLLGAAQVLGVVSAGAAHGARPPRSGARLPPGLGCRALKSEGGASRRAARRASTRGAQNPALLRGRADRRGGLPAAPTLINRLGRAGPASQPAPGEAASSTPTPGSPSFLSPSLPASLTQRPPPSPSGPSGVEAVGWSSGSQTPLARRLKLEEMGFLKVQELGRGRGEAMPWSRMKVTLQTFLSQSASLSLSFPYRI